MRRNDIDRERAAATGDPDRPAYDNPVGNKGELAAGNNTRPTKRRPPSPEPQGQDSDKKLGVKPPEAGSTEPGKKTPVSG